MVAKINRGSDIYGAVAYNQNKVNEGKARIIYGNNMITDITGDPSNVMQKTLLSFEDYLLANKNTEKPVLHISLNPTLSDTLSDSEFSALAKDYMEKMGYGNQPYIVYLHNDISRAHIHIVTTCVDENGNKISDKYEWRRSMTACRELETKYNLQRVTDTRRELSGIFLKKADYKAGDLKHQVSNILKSVFSTYRFQSFGEYSALLSCFNIEARQVKGEHEGVPFVGVVYCVTDDSGTPVSALIKSSLIDKRFTSAGIAKRIAHNTKDFKAGKWKPKIRDTITLAMQGSRHDPERFRRLLAEKEIDVVFRKNEAGRIYGVTFINHNTREVYNGSRLGKEFSANTFNDFFSRKEEKINMSDNTLRQQAGSYDTQMESSASQVVGALNFEQHGTDYQEEAFARKLRRKKKKRGRGF